MYHRRDAFTGVVAFQFTIGFQAVFQLGQFVKLPSETAVPVGVSGLYHVNSLCSP